MTSKPLVYIHNTEEDEPVWGLTKSGQRILNDYFDLVTKQDLNTNPAVAAHIQGSLYRMDMSDAFPEILPTMTSLQVITTLSTGVDWVPIQMFRDMGIQVGYCPAYKQQNKTIADFAMLLLLAVNRKFLEGTYLNLCKV